MGSTADMAFPASSSPAQGGLNAAQAGFMANLAAHLGLAPSDGMALMAPRHVVGPSGLGCRVALHPERPAVKVLTLLPMSPVEFFGPGVDVLLTVQGELLNSLGWYLGSSDEGLLQLATMSWIDDAARAALELDLANGVGLAVVRRLLQPIPSQGQETGT